MSISPISKLSLTDMKISLYTVCVPDPMRSSSISLSQSSMNEVLKFLKKLSIHWLKNWK